MLGRPVVTEPGTRFDYNDGVSVLLGKIVRARLPASGSMSGPRNASLAPSASTSTTGRWPRTERVDSEGGLYLSAHDLARIGYLMLRHGEWDGRQIVSREWVEASTAPVIPDISPDNGRPDTGYGYQWWVPRRGDGEPRVFAGNGYGGQFLHVVPEYDLISVFNGWTLHERPRFSSWRALRERILPAVVAKGKTGDDAR